MPECPSLVPRCLITICVCTHVDWFVDFHRIVAWVSSVDKQYHGGLQESSDTLRDAVLDWAARDKVIRKGFAVSSCRHFCGNIAGTACIPFASGMATQLLQAQRTGPHSLRSGIIISAFSARLLLTGPWAGRHPEDVAHQQHPGQWGGFPAQGGGLGRGPRRRTPVGPGVCKALSYHKNHHGSAFSTVSVT